MLPIIAQNYLASNSTPETWPYSCGSPSRSSHPLTSNDVSSTTTTTATPWRRIRMAPRLLSTVATLIYTEGNDRRFELFQTATCDVDHSHVLNRPRPESVALRRDGRVRRRVRDARRPDRGELLAQHRNHLL